MSSEQAEGFFSLNSLNWPSLRSMVNTAMAPSAETTKSLGASKSCRKWDLFFFSPGVCATHPLCVSVSGVGYFRLDSEHTVASLCVCMSPRSNGSDRHVADIQSSGIINNSA